MTNHNVFKHNTAPGTHTPVGLALSDDSRWSIAGGDEIASNIVFHLAEVLQLKPYNSFGSRLIVLSDNPKNELTNADRRSHALNSFRPAAVLNDNSDPLVETAASFSKTVSFSKNSQTVVCNVIPAENGDLLALQLMQVAGIICLYSQDKGGVLLHGALAERNGYGVILAGPGDAGKTTASLRLPKPWHARCDDSTLVVRDRHGAYWAHPWPTWSRFMFGGTGGSWNVQRALPLKGIFFLSQATQDQVVPIGGGEAACMLVNSTEQVWRPMVLGLPRDSFRKGCLQRFNNICALVKAVPCYRLCLSRKGSFWKEIERVMGGNGEVTRG
jgi:SynChlorMet cassette protein ScmC